MSFTTLRSFSVIVGGLGNFGNKLYTRPARINNITKLGSLSSLLLRQYRQYSLKRYTKEHEWIEVDNGVGVIGITDYAQNALGDVVYVEIPEVGKVVETSGHIIGAVESVKAASDIYAPVTGKIIESNDKLVDEPSLINKSPEGDGWLCKMELSDSSELDELLDINAYEEHCINESH